MQNNDISTAAPNEALPTEELAVCKKCGAQREIGSELCPWCGADKTGTQILPFKFRFPKIEPKESKTRCCDRKSHSDPAPFRCCRRGAVFSVSDSVGAFHASSLCYYRSGGIHRRKCGSVRRNICDIQTAHQHLGKRKQRLAYRCHVDCHLCPLRATQYHSVLVRGGRHGNYVSAHGARPPHPRFCRYCDL